MTETTTKVGLPPIEIRQTIAGESIDGSHLVLRGDAQFRTALRSIVDGILTIGEKTIIEAQGKYDALVSKGIKPQVAVNVLPTIKVMGLSAYGAEVTTDVRVMAFNKSSPQKDEDGKRIGFGKVLPAVSINFRKSGRENINNLVVMKANNEYYPDAQEDVYSIIVRELGDRDSKEPIGVVSPSDIAYAHGVGDDEMQLHDCLLGARIEEDEAPKKWQKTTTNRQEAIRALLESLDPEVRKLVEEKLH